jgi:hypothetical protein
MKFDGILQFSSSCLGRHPGGHRDRRPSSPMTLCPPRLNPAPFPCAMLLPSSGTRPSYTGQYSTIMCRRKARMYGSEEKVAAPLVRTLLLRVVPPNCRRCDLFLDGDNGQGVKLAPPNGKVCIPVRCVCSRPRRICPT